MHTQKNGPVATERAGRCSVAKSHTKATATPHKQQQQSGCVLHRCISRVFAAAAAQAHLLQLDAVLFQQGDECVGII